MVFTIYLIETTTTMLLILDHMQYVLKEKLEIVVFFTFLFQSNILYKLSINQLQICARKRWQSNLESKISFCHA